MVGSWIGATTEAGGSFTLSSPKQGHVTVESRVDNTLPSENDVLRLKLEIPPFSIHGALTFNVAGPNRDLRFKPDAGSKFNLTLANKSIDVSEEFRCEVANIGDNDIGVYWEDDDNIGISATLDEISESGNRLTLTSKSVDFSKNLKVSVRCGKTWWGKSVVGSHGLLSLRYRQ